MDTKIIEIYCDHCYCGEMKNGNEMHSNHPVRIMISKNDDNTFGIFAFSLGDSPNNFYEYQGPHSSIISDYISCIENTFQLLIGNMVIDNFGNRIDV